jgi:hypothetical protein
MQCPKFKPQYFKKKKEILSLSTTWINLEDIVLSKISQAQKDKYDSTYLGQLT